MFFGSRFVHYNIALLLEVKIVEVYVAVHQKELSGLMGNDEYMKDKCQSRSIIASKVASLYYNICTG